MSAQNPITSMTLNSDRDNVAQTEDFAKEISREIDLGEDRYNQLLLTLSEAVTNAIVHGNGEDPSKKVYINAWTDNGYLHLRIKDEGEGFDPAQLPDPLKDQNLLKEGGRGVFLMRQYADEVRFSDEGSTVTLLFALDE